MATAACAPRSIPYDVRAAPCTQLPPSGILRTAANAATDIIAAIADKRQIDQPRRRWDSRKRVNTKDRHDRDSDTKKITVGGYACAIARPARAATAASRR